MISVSSPQGTPFEQAVLASRLLSRDELDEAAAAVRTDREPGDVEDAPTDEQLADKLVELGRLNAWQAGQLLEGRTKFNLGPYWIVESIGRGGMGQVFKAEHAVLGRGVAIKVLPREKATPQAITNFTREIRAQARLDHENLVRAFDAGEDGNVYYLVTEYVPGTDLRKLVRRSGPLTVEAAANIISQVAAGLKHAHEQGLIHRDVKPGNVLVTPDGRAKLSDMGLSGPLVPDAENDPRFGKIVGTADYLSPDHIKYPWDPTPAWDIYSLGCTLYYAVTGKVPFPRGSTADKARAHCELRPLDPRRLTPQLDPAFVEVMADMLAKDPAERIPSAEEVIARLAPWTSVPAPIATDDADLGGRAGPTGPLRSPPGPGGGARSRPASKPAKPDEVDPGDTKSEFPEIPDSTAGQAGSFGEAGQMTRPVASAADDTASGVGIDSQRDHSFSILFPLAVLVLLPVGLVGAVMLISWVFQLLR